MELAPGQSFDVEVDVATLQIMEERIQIWIIL